MVRVSQTMVRDPETMVWLTLTMVWDSKTTVWVATTKFPQPKPCFPLPKHGKGSQTMVRVSQTMVSVTRNHVWQNLPIRLAIDIPRSENLNQGESTGREIRFRDWSLITGRGGGYKMGGGRASKRLPLQKGGWGVRYFSRAEGGGTTSFEVSFES